MQFTYYKSLKIAIKIDGMVHVNINNSKSFKGILPFNSIINISQELIMNQLHRDKRRLMIPAKIQEATSIISGQINTLPFAIFLLSFLLLYPGEALGKDQRQSLLLKAGWVNYLNGYQPAMAIKTTTGSKTNPQGIITITGMLKGPNGSKWEHMATLPVGMRPNKRLIFNVNTQDRTARVDVLPNGQIHFIVGHTGYGWVSLDGISFPLGKSWDLRLSPGWKNCDEGYAPAGTVRTDNLVMLNGLVKQETGNLIATLPNHLHPKRRLIFNLNSHDQTTRVDVRPNGEIRLVTQTPRSRWVSLNGITFELDGGKPLKLVNGWQNYGDVFTPASASRVGNRIIVSGLIKGQNWGHVATLPQNMWPKHRLIFNLNTNETTCRVDVVADGRIIWIAGGKGNGYFSLDGISFILAETGASLTVQPQIGGPRILTRPKRQLPKQHFTSHKRLPLANGWSDYLGDYSSATVSKTGDLVIVSGLIKSPSKDWNRIATLPSGLRPPKRLIFNLNCQTDTSRVDIFPNGEIKWIAGGHGHGWLSLSGIQFSTKSGTSLPLTSPWKNYRDVFKGEHAPASMTKIGSIISLSGLILKQTAPFTANEHILTLPEGARPSKTLMFNVNGHSKTQRVDLNPDGKLHWIAGQHDANWVSLDGITFSVQSGTQVNPRNGFRNYGDGWSTVQVKHESNLVYLSGLVKPGAPGQPIVQLPSNLRPKERMIFNLGSDGRPVRMDVDANGNVTRITGPRDFRWVNLTGISFPLNLPTSGSGRSKDQHARANSSGSAVEGSGGGNDGLVRSIVMEFKNDLANLGASSSTLFSGISINFPNDWLSKRDAWVPRTENVGHGDTLQTLEKSITVKVPSAPSITFNLFLYRYKPNTQVAKKPQLAITIEKAALDNIIGELKETPLGELKAKSLTFIYVPMPKSGHKESFPKRAFPKDVWTQISNTFSGFTTKLGSDLDIRPGFSVWGLVANEDTSEVTTLLEEVGGDLGTVRVYGAIGKKKTKVRGSNRSKEINSRYISLVRQGDWHPFGVTDITVSQPTLRYEQWGGQNNKGKRIQFWGQGKVVLNGEEKSKAFMFAQRTKDPGDSDRKPNPKGTGFILDAQNLSFTDAFALIDAYSNAGEELIKEGLKDTPDEVVNSITTLMSGINGTKKTFGNALDILKIERRSNYPDSPALSDHREPIFALVTPYEVIPDELSTSNDSSNVLPQEGKYFRFSGDMTIFGKKIIGSTIDISKNGISADIKLADLGNWGVVDLNDVSFGLDTSSPDPLSLVSDVKLFGLPEIKNITIPATASGFTMKVNEKCPLYPSFSVTAAGFMIGEGDGFSGSLPDPKDCAGEVLKLLLEKGEEAVAAVTSFAKDTFDEAIFGPGKDVADWFKSKGVTGAVVKKFSDARDTFEKGGKDAWNKTGGKVFSLP